MNVQGNQGSRPNYLSTLSPIQLPNLPYVEDTHQQWIVSRQNVVYLSELIILCIGRCSPLPIPGYRDRFRLATSLLEQFVSSGPTKPRRVSNCLAISFSLLTWFFSSNIVGHLGGVENESVKIRQVALFAHTNATFGQAVANGVGVAVVPISFPTGPTWLNTTVLSHNSTLTL